MTREKAIRDRDQCLENQEPVNKDSQISQLEAVIREKEEALSRIYHSHGWKFLLKYYQIRDRTLSVDNTLGQLAKYLWKNITSITQKQSGFSSTGLKQVIRMEPFPGATKPQLGDKICDMFIKHPPYDGSIQKLTMSSYDPVRYATLALAIDKIRKEQIIGSFAELGVWRGDTSRIIHLCAPERTLFLFDTFEGFPREDQEQEDNRFRDTNVKIVKETIGDLTNVVIKKGYFPETAEGLENEVFAFVMLDLDLYKPTLAGIEFFYPRMNRGGYIFVHDYNAPASWSPVAKAINEFMGDKPEKLIEIPDVWGTIIIRKM